MQPTADTSGHFSRQRVEGRAAPRSRYMSVPGLLIVLALLTAGPARGLGSAVDAAPQPAIGVTMSDEAGLQVGVGSTGALGRGYASTVNDTGVDLTVTPALFPGPGHSPILLTDSRGIAVAPWDATAGIAPAFGSAYGKNSGYDFELAWEIGVDALAIPWGMAVDGAGNVYVAVIAFWVVQKYASDGTLLGSIGSYGPGDGQFLGYPFDVAVDGAGNVYVLESGINRVQKFSPDGTFLARLGSTGDGNGEFNNPAGIAVDGANNLYVSDRGNGRIQKFSSTGAYLTQWDDGVVGPIWNPGAVAADNTGHIYVLEGTQVNKFTSSGALVMQWGGGGAGDGEFNGPTDVTVDTAGNVYVSDSLNNRIQKFTSSGTYLTQWGSGGTGNGQFDNPAGVAVDGAGHVYVADSSNDRIQRFAPASSVGTGSLLIDITPQAAADFGAQWRVDGGPWHNSGETVGGLAEGPHEVTYKPIDWQLPGSWHEPEPESLWIFPDYTMTDYGEYQFYPVNGFLHVFLSPKAAVDAGAQWRLDDGAWRNSGEALPLPAAGEHTVTFKTIPGWIAPTPQSITPGAISVYMFSTYTPASETGSLTATIEPEEAVAAGAQWWVDDGSPQASGATVTGLTQGSHTVHCSAVPGFVQPADREVTVAAGQTVDVTLSYVAAPGPGSNEYIFDRAWGGWGIDPGQFYWGPLNLTIDGSGTVYVPDFWGSVYSRVRMYTASGVLLGEWGQMGNEDGYLSSGLLGLTVGADGNLYLADTGNDRIQVFTPSGVFVTNWGSEGSGPGQFDAPFDVATDRSGNVYVVDEKNERIQKFTASGAYITQWGRPGDGNGEFYGPIAVAVDASDNVYVSDSGHARIQKFTSSGTYLSHWGSSGTGDGQFHSPAGIAVDAAGNVFVADRRNHRIQKFTSSGVYLTQWGGFGTAQGQFDEPCDVAVDATGNVYVADWQNHRIQKFRPGAPATTGAVRVEITPPGAASAGARWWVDQGAPQLGGATVTGLTPGSHTIHCSAATGYNKPADTAVTVVAGQTQEVTLTYTPAPPQTGSLKVTLAPPGAASTARWVLNGQQHLSGETVSGLAAGSVHVTFTDVSGWIAPAPIDVVITAGQTAQRTATYTADAGCTAPLAPTGLDASDGAHTGWVWVQWNASPGASEYRVLRSTGSNPAVATVARDWDASTAFADYSAPAASGTSSSGCTGGSPATPRPINYWVVARSDCGESGFSSSDSGYRGTGAKALRDRTVWETALPARAAGDRARALRGDSPFYVRLRADDPIDPGSVQGRVTWSGGESSAIEWRPLKDSSRDGWVVYVPEQAWPAGEVVSLTVQGQTTQGRAVGPVTQRFVVSADGALDPPTANTAPVSDKEATPSFGEGVGLACRVTPDAAFDSPQRIWLPVPTGADPAALTLYYRLEAGPHSAWYPAEAVEGFLVSGTRAVADVDGTAYVGFDLWHGGVVQLGEAEAVRQAAAVPLASSFRGLIGDTVVLLAVTLVLVVSRRRKCGNRAGLSRETAGG